jgi:regulator of replication initiation timing
MKLFGWYLSRVDWESRHNWISGELVKQRTVSKVLDSVGNEYIERNTDSYLEAADLRNRLDEAKSAKAASDAELVKVQRELAKEKRSNAALRGANKRLKG